MATIEEAPICILLIDPCPLTRTGLRLIIENQADMSVVGQAGNINEALTLAAEMKPDIILFVYKPEEGLDLTVPKMLIKCWEEAHIILVTDPKDCDFYVKAAKSGIVGVVLKTQSPEILIKAICKVHEGEVWLERAWIANMVMSSIHGTSDGKVDANAEIENKLTKREMDLIPLIGRGLKNKEIAEELFIAESTVRHHLTSIYRKLGVSGRVELLLFAQQHKLI